MLLDQGLLEQAEDEEVALEGQYVGAWTDRRCEAPDESQQEGTGCRPFMASELLLLLGIAWCDSARASSEPRVGGGEEGLLFFGGAECFSWARDIGLEELKVGMMLGSL